MTVHSFHIFDRNGKTLFTKRYIKPLGGSGMSPAEEEAQLSEQRKLIFGMVYSLKELTGSLSPTEGPGNLQLVKTGASTLYNYETVSGLRFVLYTTAETSVGRNASSSSDSGSTTPILTSSGLAASSALGGGGSSSNNTPLHTPPSSAPNSSHGTNNVANTSNVMTSPQVTSNIRAALKHVYEHIWVSFVVRSPLYKPIDPNIGSTNFESSLDNYLKGMVWFR